MVTCSCGKPMDKLPNWLTSVQVEFVCNNCPNRQVKPIAQLAAETAQAAARAESNPRTMGELEAEEDLDD